MDDQEKTEAEKNKSQEATSNPNDWKPTAREIKAENDALELELNRKAELDARLMLGGTTEAGTEPHEKTEEERKKELAKEFFKGTVIEGALERHG